LRDSSGREDDKKKIRKELGSSEKELVDSRIGRSLLVIVTTVFEENSLYTLDFLRFFVFFLPVLEKTYIRMRASSWDMEREETPERIP